MDILQSSWTGNSWEVQDGLLNKPNSTQANAGAKQAAENPG